MPLWVMKGKSVGAGSTPAIDHRPHGLGERHRTARIRFRFVCDTDRTRRDEVARLFAVGREVRGGEEDLSLAQHTAFKCLWPRGLYDHVASRTGLLGAGYDACACFDMGLIARTDARAGRRRDRHACPQPPSRRRSRASARRHTHALDVPGTTNAPDIASALSG